MLARLSAQRAASLARAPCALQARAGSWVSTAEKDNIDRQMEGAKMIYVVRHAERHDRSTPDGWSELALRPQDTPLSQRGLRQSRRLGKWSCAASATRPRGAHLRRFPRRASRRRPRRAPRPISGAVGRRAAAVELLAARRPSAPRHGIHRSTPQVLRPPARAAAAGHLREPLHPVYPDGRRHRVGARGPAARGSAPAFSLARRASSVSAFLGARRA